MDEYGIDQLVPAARLLGATATAVYNIDTNQDGQVSTIEGLNAVQTIVVKAMPLFNNSLPVMKQQLMDLSEEELIQLQEAFAQENGIGKEAARRLFNKGFAAVLHTADFILEIAAIKAEQADA